MKNFRISGIIGVVLVIASMMLGPMAIASPSAHDPTDIDILLVHPDAGTMLVTEVDQDTDTLVAKITTSDYTITATTWESPPARAIPDAEPVHRLPTIIWRPVDHVLWYHLE